MEHATEPHIVSADRIDHSLIITFSDEQCGLYSSALLYHLLPQAEKLSDLEDDTSKSQASESRR